MHNILDLDAFALDRPGSDDWKALLQRCRDDLARDGMFNLEGFMRPAVAAQEAVNLADAFATDSFRHEREHNIYFSASIDGMSANHPALQSFRTSNQTLCADQFSDSALITLYEWPEFAIFLAATMNRPQLHIMDDPLARVNAMSYHEGQMLSWHFDRSEFTTTLLLQAPITGGEFEYRSDLRTETDPNYNSVAQLLQGKDPKVKRLSLSPGTLNVFKGKNTAHRVTPVTGNRARIIAVFSFYERPGVTFTPEERIGFYGRAS